MSVRPSVTLVDCDGSPENAGLENGGPQKSRGWKMQDWKMTDESAWLENDGLENDLFLRHRLGVVLELRCR